MHVSETILLQFLTDHGLDIGQDDHSTDDGLFTLKDTIGHCMKGLGWCSIQHAKKPKIL